jgi:hypothetical protein
MRAGKPTWPSFGDVLLTVIEPAGIVQPAGGGRWEGKYPPPAD